MARPSIAEMASTTTSDAKATATSKAGAPKAEQEPVVDFKILGITLGSIAGFILIILGLLWIIKCVRRRRDPKLAAKEDEVNAVERANGDGTAMAIVMTAVTSPSTTNPPRLLSNDKRHDRNRTLGSSAGGNTSTMGRMGKGSISNPTYVPHTTTDAFSQKNYKHFPISRPLPVHQQQGSVGSQTGRLAGPMPGPAINFNHPQRPMSRGNSSAGGMHFPPSNVVRPLRPSVVGAAPVMLPRQATTHGVLAPPSSSSGVGTTTTSSSGVGVGVGVGTRPTPQRNGSTRRSSGWNRYWSGGSALNMIGFNRNSGKEDRKSTYTTQSGTQPSDQESVYSTDMQGQRVVSDHRDYIPPPLNFAQTGTRMSRVTQGSPVIHPKTSRDFPLQTGRVGRIRGTDSVSSLSSYGEDPIDAFSSGVPTSEPEAQQWNPLAAHDWNGGRGTSSVYTVDSYYAKSNQGHQYEVKLPKQGERLSDQRRDNEYLEPPRANTKRRRSVVAPEQIDDYANAYAPPFRQGQRQQQFHAQPAQQANRNIILDLVDEYGRPNIYPTQEEQRYHQQHRMNERGNGGAQQRYQEQQYRQLNQRQHKMNQQVDEGDYGHYQPPRTMHAQRGNPEPRSDDMSWLNLGR